jgi:hypothetical protein
MQTPITPLISLPSNNVGCIPKIGYWLGHFWSLCLVPLGLIKCVAETAFTYFSKVFTYFSKQDSPSSSSISVSPGTDIEPSRITLKEFKKEELAGDQTMLKIDEVRKESPMLQLKQPISLETLSSALPVNSKTADEISQLLEVPQDNKPIDTTIHCDTSVENLPTKNVELTDERAPKFTKFKRRVPKKQNHSTQAILQPPPSSFNSMPPTIVETSNAHPTQSAPRVIDVPDDGNCLLYAIGIGLRKIYAEYPDIQKTLNWNISSEQLQKIFNTSELIKKLEPTNGLKQKLTKHLAKLLEAPGKQLRQQAAAYLENNLTNERVRLALFDGINSHLEAARKQIQEAEELVSILMMDIQALINQPETMDDESQLTEKMTHLRFTQESIDLQKANLLSENNLQGYIDITKQDHVYCGIPQLFALSKIYNIPIRVVYKYGKADQYSEIYNEEVNIGRSSPLPILTVAHVNENHFKLLSS